MTRHLRAFAEISAHAEQALVQELFPSDNYVGGETQISGFQDEEDKKPLHHSIGFFLRLHPRRMLILKS
jgi:hypothetical protein